MNDVCGFCGAIQKSKWQKLETALRDGRELLLAQKHSVFIGWYSIREGSWMDALGKFSPPEYWSPLPEPPKEQGEANE